MKHSGLFVVASEHGLHVRPAAELVQTATTFKARIKFFSNGIAADGKSIMSLLLLGALQGAQVRITADGVDAEQALHALRRLPCLAAAS